MDLGLSRIRGGGCSLRGGAVSGDVALNAASIACLDGRINYASDEAGAIPRDVVEFPTVVAFDRTGLAVSCEMVGAAAFVADDDPAMAACVQVSSSATTHAYAHTHAHVHVHIAKVSMVRGVIVAWLVPAITCHMTLHHKV